MRVNDNNIYVETAAIHCNNGGTHIPLPEGPALLRPQPVPEEAGSHYGPEDDRGAGPDGLLVGRAQTAPAVGRERRDGAQPG